MKKNLLSILSAFLGILLCGSLYAQTAENWSDVIAEEKGDTVVVMGYSSNFFNTLLTAVKGDTTATGERKNSNRVYETIPGDIYISDVTLELDVSVPMLKIVGPPLTSSMPPLHVRAVRGDGVFDKTFFQTNGDIYMSNQYFCFATITDTYDREFVRVMNNGAHVEYDGCIFEFTDWTQTLPQSKFQSFIYKNCKFLNVGHEANLEKGCMLEIRSVCPDTIWIENSTFLNGGSFIQALSLTAPNFCYLNHNTVVNCLQPPMLFPSVGEMVVENNLFVNAGMVPMYVGFNAWTESDDAVPVSLIYADTVKQVTVTDWWTTEDVVTYPFTKNEGGVTVVDESKRKILFENNSTFWDARIENMVKSQMQPIPAEVGEQWQSQSIVMNSVTKAMFDDNAGYPYFVEGENLSIQPDFKNIDYKIDEWISFVISNCTPGAPGGGDFMPWWRTNMLTEVYMPDWPTLADLSYTDATLMYAGVNKYPLGDLNWFPNLKKSWDNTNEAPKLIEALKSGKTVDDWAAVGIEGNQKLEKGNMSVYPNPVTNTATINFDLSKAANIELAIYSLDGKKLKVIEQGYKVIGNHAVELSKDNLKPGMYIIDLKIDNSNGMSKRISIR